MAQVRVAEISTLRSHINSRLFQVVIAEDNLVPDSFFSEHCSSPLSVLFHQVLQTLSFI